MRVAWLKDLRLKDLEQVGGKNASLGEMMSGLAAAGIRVPGGQPGPANLPATRRRKPASPGVLRRSMAVAEADGGRPAIGADPVHRRARARGNGGTCDYRARARHHP